MDEKDFNTMVTADVSKQTVQHIFAALDDEATPHALRIGKGTKPHTKRITIYCDAKNVAYFNEVISNENKTTI